jgi:glycosyltransferase involved in cell wall biosynthesis
MRLLIFAKQYLPEISAQSIRISQIAKRFCQKDKDLQVRVVVFDPEGRRIGKSDGSEDKIEVARYGRKLLPAAAFRPQSLNPLLLMKWIWITIREIRAFEPDVVLSTTPPFPSSTALHVASKIESKKFAYIIDYRDDLTSVIDGMADRRRFYIKYPLKIANKLMSYLLFKSIKNAALVSTVNESLQTKLQELNHRVLLVPNGLDIKELEELNFNFDRDRVLAKNGIADRESRIIIFLGDLNMPYYMPEAILEPMRALRKKGYNLTYLIIGDGSRRKIIEDAARELGLERFVSILGKKNHREAMELLMASDVAFHTLEKSDPQSRHAIGTKVYEYLGCRLPILAVADEDSAVSRLIREKGAGIAVGWDRMDQIESALREILDHPEVYRKNLMRNYADFLCRFDRNRGIDRLYDGIKSLKSQKI